MRRAQPGRAQFFPDTSVRDAGSEQTRIQLASILGQPPGLHLSRQQSLRVMKDAVRRQEIGHFCQRSRDRLLQFVPGCKVLPLALPSHWGPQASAQHQSLLCFNAERVFEADYAPCPADSGGLKASRSGAGSCTTASEWVQGMP